MIPLDKVTEFVYEHFPKVTTGNGGTHFIARCILCGDSKKNPRKRRFNLDYKNGNPVYRCWNCDRSGSFLALYAELNGISYERAKEEIFKFDSDSIKRRISKKRKISTQENGSDFHEYVREDCLSIHSEGKNFQEKKFIEVLQNFVQDRRIPIDYKVWVAVKGEYKGRFIIPIFDENGKVIYFQGRSIHEEILPKYKNPPVGRKNIIWNENFFDREKHIVITEGIVDAMMFGSQGTTSLGVVVTEEFVKKILSMTDAGVIIIFDNDSAGFKSLRNFLSGKRANKYSKKLRYFLFPKKFKKCKDINNVVVMHNVTDIYDLVVRNSCPYSTAYVKLWNRNR